MHYNYICYRRYLNFITKIIPESCLSYCSLYIIERPHLIINSKVHSCAVIVLRKYSKYNYSLEERLLRLRNKLQSALLFNEHLEFKNRSFICSGDGYEMSFIVEAYKKNSSITAFIDNNCNIHIEPLFRMPTSKSIKMAKSLAGMIWNWNISKSPFQNFLDEADLIDKYPNTADRFAFIVKREFKKSNKSYAELMAPFKM